MKKDNNGANRVSRVQIIHVNYFDRSKLYFSIDVINVDRFFTWLLSNETIKQTALRLVSTQTNVCWEFIRISSEK